ncbi:hypothetical protein [Brevundimonas nasdae]|uniref:Uncharacterized protein n=1 Tax=Brevundimonas nasdae TaxID=172043 RepID=A0ABX8TFZ7_9CAUL|nr:hypothetical protein [Brevundimonas nasdae]QYC09594.1 hypothetical protein KWG56_13500 [Brevundimonas nasdae]QYC15643.1 hypothetical protein KWG63_08825 [Brevundimonas nasdae]
MKRFLTFPRLAMLFAGVFGLAVIGVFAIQNYWVAPGKRCEAAGKWYDMENRICAQPISIAEITGRPIGVSRAEASAEKNRELVKIENEIALQNQARDAETARQKAALAARKGN